MKSTNEIEEILKHYKTELREKYKIKEIGIFGSYMRGEQTEISDIDVLVEFDEVPYLLTFLEIERYLERVLDIKVDLVEKMSLRSRIRERILHEVEFV